MCEILSVQSRKNLGAPDVQLSPISGDFALSPADLKREGHSGDDIIRILEGFPLSVGGVCPSQVGPAPQGEDPESTASGFRVWGPGFRV